jgi:FkbM family methyltransferase
MTDPQQSLAAEQSSLREAGFQPQRHAAGVTLVRRFLWPFIRPFCFHLLASIRALETRLTARLDHHQQELDARAGASHGDLEAQIAALRGELAALAGRAIHAGDLHTLVVRHAAQRAELVAITNRAIWVENAVEQAAARLDDMNRQVAQLGERHGSVEHRLERLGQEAAQQAAGHALLEKRHRLMLASISHGIFVVKAGELISDTAVREGKWDAHIIEVATLAARSLKDRGGTGKASLAIDAGAHFGLVSVALGQLFDRVISFEPNEFNASLLRANVSLNGLDGRVQVHRAGLFSRSTRLSLAPSDRQEIPLPFDEQGNFDPLSASNLGAYSFAEAGSGLSDATAYALDDLKLDTLSFLKIDVQGADGEVLMGALQTIERCHPWIVFEWEDALSAAFGVDFDTLKDRLVGMGYRLSVLKRHNSKQVDYLAVPGTDVRHLPTMDEGADLAVVHP